ncbi:hypothetical protein MTsPCn9_16470 [Croceitalea sp. MTPC9]|uniref:DUF4199 domain-containing protein n=1 Tax=unclassified Croceitalea TaxID=2632280 RepID=UPI002B36992F|nr:hypothetical protein MTsPCn6_09320 [Croceitalea sp. MTPC6]GMN16711.1 hypothetical protein MTsPCn9_16470 [Croceitalea sp. MTPC9]
MKKFVTEIKWGIIFTIAALLWMVLEKALGWHDTHIEKHAIYTNFFAIIAIVIFVFAIREKRDKDLGGKMTWFQGVASGIIVSVVVAILSPLSQYLTHEFITPDYFKNAIAYAVESKGLSQKNAETFFSFKSYLIQSAFGALGMGTVTSAIVALFLKKK